MIRSIPPKASIPISVRTSVAFRRPAQKSRERISIKGFKEKLSWLQEHLQELQELNASKNIRDEVKESIKRLKEELGILGR